MAIVWDDTLNTGIPDIDAQHQELFHTVNRLDDALNAGQGQHEIVKVLSFTGQYIERHFRFEEDYFERYDCPEKVRNKEEHARFIRRFTELMKEFCRQGESLALCWKIHAELSTWLIRHIVVVDSKLGLYVRGKEKL